MAVWKFKGCPKCHGDVCLGVDFDGWYEECLQCSFRRALKSLDEFQETPVETEKKQAVAGTRKPRR